MPDKAQENPVPTLRESVHGGTYFRTFGAANSETDPVVLIHGVGLDHAMWTAQVAALETHFQVIPYDMLGHGQSAQPPDVRHLIDFVRQLDQLLMNLNVSRAAIVGFSMGGMVAQAYAAAYPEKVAKLFLMNTVFRRSDEQRAGVLGRYEQSAAGEIENLAEAALGRWFSNAFRETDPAAVNAVRRRMLSNDPEGYLKAYKVFATSDEEAAEGLAGVSCPALVMTGAHDTGSTPAMAEGLAAALPDARPLILSGLSHMAPIEGADQVNRALLDFLA